MGLQENLGALSDGGIKSEGVPAREIQSWMCQKHAILDDCFQKVSAAIERILKRSDANEI